MTTEIQRKRIRRLNAWKKMLSSMPNVRPRHPLHDPDDYRKTRRAESTDRFHDPGFSELETELAAWDAASDDDFAKFEESLG